MKIPVRERKKEAGQAILLVVLAMSIFLLGAVGFAIDGSHLYAQRQMAQAAADATAQAAIKTIFDGTTATGFPTGWSGGSFNCTSANAAASPCVYAQKNGFGTADTIALDFPGSVTGVTLTPNASYPARAAHVTITRSVPTTLMRLLGPTSSNISAEATAAILQNTSPIPIIVLHPFNPNSFLIKGNPNITICGGPQRSIQVNSTSSTAANQTGTATVDLSKGGPADTAGNCTTGNGTDFGALGGIPPPACGTSGTALGTCLPSWLTPTGTAEHYYQPAAPISDPLANVPYPPSKPTAGARTTSAPPFHGCTAALLATLTGSPVCAYYTAGSYNDGIKSTNEVAVFQPGVYWMDDATSNPHHNYGFQSGANSTMMMCTDCGTDTTTHGTGNAGMMVYIHDQGTFNVGANGNVNLLGSASSSDYKGILFFEDRNAPANTGTSGSHSLGGGGNLVLQGTIYTTNTTMTASTYQEVHITGSSGNTTQIKGEIIVSELGLGGGGTINMNLDPNVVLPVDKVALVK